MVELKTAVLYGAAASIPATLLGADEQTVDALYNYGLDVGRAFQIQDDLLDLTTPSEKLGKQRGSDLVENKQTLVTLHARQQGVDVGDLVDTDSVEAVSEAEIDDAVERLREVGSIEYARQTGQDLIASGKQNLEVLPDNEARYLLEGIANYLVERDY
jgi:geranylgeranyl diphosphate synthase type I